MIINKQKTYNIPLTTYKEHLQIFDNENDNEIRQIGIDVITEIEKLCSIDVVPTINYLEDYCIRTNVYRINHSNITISAITTTNNLSTTPTSIPLTQDDYFVQKANQYTDLFFKTFRSTEKIEITYSSGYAYDAIPPDLQRAIKLRVAYYFDADRNNTIQNQNESKAFDRLISPYKNLII